MISFLSYLLVFICIVFFSKKDYLNVVYIYLNLVLIISWFIIMIINKRKFKIDSKAVGFDINSLFIVVLIIASNLITNFSLANLTFGYIYYFLFVLSFIKSVKNKDYAMNEININNNKLFDTYVLIYLTTILSDILKYKI